MQKRIHAYFSGSVQGVGFRFSAVHHGNGLGVSGWVKNLTDGRVEVVAEGEEAAIKEFIARLDRDMGRYVRGVDIVWEEPTGEFRAFEVSFR